jgi:hypothetical protein
MSPQTLRLLALVSSAAVIGASLLFCTCWLVHPLGFVLAPLGSILLLLGTGNLVSTLRLQTSAQKKAHG